MPSAWQVTPGAGSSKEIRSPIDHAAFNPALQMCKICIARHQNDDLGPLLDGSSIASPAVEPSATGAELAIRQPRSLRLPGRLAGGTMINSL
jgi:hypothetical protein